MADRYSVSPSFSYHMGITNSCSLISFCSEEIKIARIIQARARNDQDAINSEEGDEGGGVISPLQNEALVLNYAISLRMPRRTGDWCVLAYLTVVLTFFEIKEPRLIKASNQVLGRELNDRAPGPTETDLECDISRQTYQINRDQIGMLLEAGPKRTEKVTNLKQVIDTKSKALQAPKETMDNVAKVAPQASLAWVGVCFGLEVAFPPPSLTHSPMPSYP